MQKISLKSGNMEQLELDFGAQTSPETPQMELDFGFANGALSPLEDWKARRAAARAAFSQSVGLPVGEKVELTLRDGLILRGILEPRDGEGLWIETVNRGPALHLPLRINQVEFTALDIASCRIME